jgi:hypothetical protein
MNCAVTGFDYYERHYKTTGGYAKLQSDWTEKHKQMTDRIGEDLTDQVVYMDGYKFVDCKVDHTVFVFEGNLPTEMSNCTVSSGSANTLQSDNPVVANTMGIAVGLCQAGGAKASAIPGFRPLPKQ